MKIIGNEGKFYCQKGPEKQSKAFPLVFPQIMIYCPENRLIE